MRRLFVVLIITGQSTAMQHRDKNAPARTRHAHQMPQSIDNEQPLAPQLFQRFLRSGITALGVTHQIPPICYGDTNGGEMSTQATHAHDKIGTVKTIRIILHPAWIEDRYGAIKGTVLHELVHVKQLEKNNRFVARDPQRFIRGGEQEADTIAMQTITCPTCADEFAQSCAQQEFIYPFNVHDLARNACYLARKLFGRPIFKDSNYLSYQEARALAQTKNGNTLCAYHQALADDFVYRNSYLALPTLLIALTRSLTKKNTSPTIRVLAGIAAGTIGLKLAHTIHAAIEQRTKNRVASGELAP